MIGVIIKNRRIFYFQFILCENPLFAVKQQKASSKGILRSNELQLCRSR